MIIDLICYMVLIALLFWMTRLSPPQLVALSHESTIFPGKILMCAGGLATRIGLLNTPRLQMGDGILLKRCKSIHTRGMTYPIDVIFLDQAMRILRMEKDVPINQKKLTGPSGTYAVLELGSGSIDQMFAELKPYAQLKLEVQGV